MKRYSIYRCILVALFIVNLTGIFYLGNTMLDNRIPDEIKIAVDKLEQFDFSLPIEADIICEDNVNALNIDQAKINKNAIHFDLNNPFTIKSSKAGNYKIDLRLFGLIKLKQISLEVIKSTKVIPSGVPIGIYVKTDGIMVLGTGTIHSVDGLNYEPSLNILKSGDYIEYINDKSITTKEELAEAIQKSKGKDLKIKIRRGNIETKVTVTPVLTVDGDYKIGAWIRNDTQGIGTLTYITKTNDFGALGHGITDVDTNLMMDIGQGSIYKADILQIQKGAKGTPGELVGIINLADRNKFGDIYKNTEQGIFGKIEGTDLHNLVNMDAIPIAFKQEIKLGKASILCNIDNEIKAYDIMIEKISLNTKNHSKGLVIKITDKELLTKTNGIVQGMSGSPIIQNDKIIGAVTHVFIQDSTKGYGIFIENMIQNGE